MHLFLSIYWGKQINVTFLFFLFLLLFLSTKEDEGILSGGDEPEMEKSNSSTKKKQKRKKGNLTSSANVNTSINTSPSTLEESQNRLKKSSEDLLGDSSGEVRGSGDGQVSADENTENTENTSPDVRVFTLGEAAKYLIISEEEMEELLVSKEIPAKKIGKNWRVLRRNIDLYLS